MLLGLALALLLVGAWVVATRFSGPEAAPGHSDVGQNLLAQTKEVAVVEEDSGSSRVPSSLESSEPLQTPDAETQHESEKSLHPTSPPPPLQEAATKNAQQVPAEPLESPGATEKSAGPRKLAAGTAWEGAIRMRFRFVPAGTYTIGSPKDEPGRTDGETPPHAVKLTRGFWLGETEVTQLQWEELVPKNPSTFKKCGGDCPVEGVSWFEAVTFANLLSEREGLDHCYDIWDCSGEMGTESYSCDGVPFKGLDCLGYRLPTEAEWEVAARAGTTTAIYTGGLTLQGRWAAPELDLIAWYAGNSGDATHFARGKKANPWGFHDMLGNVFEWTWDSWQEEIPTTLVVDPLGPAQGAIRVFRGGSWYGNARYVRAAYRFGDQPSIRNSFLGFRLARGQVRSSPAEPEAE